MKANEAPEKIYISPRQGGDYAPYWTTDSQDGFGIEYIQTDAFIEKAAKWINDNAVKWAANIRVHGHKVTELMIEDFKKYMK